MSINFDQLPTKVRFSFLAVAQAAMYMKEDGMDEETFSKFCAEIWRSIDLNGENKFDIFLREAMRADLEKLQQYCEGL